jgi:hypothetical protein
MAEGIDWVNLAEKGWAIVKDNKADAKAKSAYCQAMPSKKQIAWEDLKGWKTATFDWPFKMYTHLDDWLGMAPSIDFRFHGEYLFGGQADGTPGLFLNNYRVSCEVENVDMPWSVDVDATVTGAPYNGGSSVPIGAIQVEVTLSYSQLTQAKTKVWRITCLGDGSRKVS